MVLPSAGRHLLTLVRRTGPTALVLQLRWLALAVLLRLRLPGCPAARVWLRLRLRAHLCATAGRSAISKLQIYCCMTIEARTDDELDEMALGACQVRVRFLAEL